MTPAETRRLARELAAEQIRMQSVCDRHRWQGQDMDELKRIQHDKLMADSKARKANGQISSASQR